MIQPEWHGSESYTQAVQRVRLIGDLLRKGKFTDVIDRSAFDSFSQFLLAVLRDGQPEYLLKYYVNMPTQTPSSDEHNVMWFGYRFIVPGVDDRLKVVINDISEVGVGIPGCFGGNVYPPTCEANEQTVREWLANPVDHSINFPRVPVFQLLPEDIQPQFIS